MERCVVVGLRNSRLHSNQIFVHRICGICTGLELASAQRGAKMSTARVVCYKTLVSNLLRDQTKILPMNLLHYLHHAWTSHG